MAEAWLNGRFLRADEPGLSLAERGFLLGEAAFETMRVVDGEIRRWPRHASRLQGGLGFLGLPAPNLDDIEDAASSLARRNAVTDGVGRLTVGGGPHGGGVVRDSRAETTVLLTLKPRPTPPASVSLALLDGARRGGLSSERFKLAGYAECLAARREARARGADMAVLCGPDGVSPACADSANLFWIDARDRVFTPALSTGALPGTTRAAVIEAAQAAGLGIKDAGLGREGLNAALAACVTNAVMGAVPVSAMDGRPLAVDHALVRRLQQFEQSAR
jgi:branched-subunit amino acid aminotransferase/4-amino-4-deoxychorismate lyase